MKKLRVLFIGELVIIWASVALGLMAGWRIPISPWIAIPVGLLLWICGFLYTLRLRGQFKEAAERHRRPPRRRGYPLVEARIAMHLGVALGFRSWPTLGAALVFAAVNLGLAAYWRHKLRDRFGRRGFRPPWPRA